MENGYHDWRIAEKFQALTICGVDHSPSSNNTNNHDSNLLQVMKAMEAAEATIKQQVEENIRLRTQLEQLDRYKLHECMPTTTERSSCSVDPWAHHQRLVHGFHDQAHQPATHVDNRIDRISNPDQPVAQTRTETETLLGNSEINGGMKVVRVSRADNASSGVSRLSSPSTITSFLPGRTNTEGEYGHGLISLTESDNPSSSLWKKDLVVKDHEHEQEIMQLRKHLADYSVKEAQIRNEKYVLEKRIAYMRLAFDQQQLDLADAASKALSYRQDIIEENIQLTYAVQDAQQERSTFVSSLLPILAEYSLQPPVPDAQSIVGNLKVLLRHSQEKLLLTESKLKELQYQLTPWRSDSNQQGNDMNITAPQSPPPHSIGGAALLNVSRNGIEMVPVSQPTYASIGGRVPASANDAQATADWDLLGRHPQSGSDGFATNNVEPNDFGMGRYSPAPSRSSAGQDVPVNFAVSQGDTRVNPHTEAIPNRQVTFHDLSRNTLRENADHAAEGNHNDRETSSNWSAGNSPYNSPLNNPSSQNPHYLPPVLEEGSSSYSEAADDDPLPGIEGLQVSGEAFPGHELEACGYSVNGTTSCNFEWVRHRQDGSVNYIEGAKQPNYLVTADDVDTYLAIEVQPLDNRMRKGELVKVFANDHKKITYDPEMRTQIEKNLNKGRASLKVFQFTGYHDIWEPASLAIKRGAYSIKGSGGGAVIAEKFTPNTFVTIPYGSPTEFMIVSDSEVGGGSSGEYLLKTDNESCSRDTVVLTLRLFIHKADETRNSRKGKKRGLFF